MYVCSKSQRYYVTSLPGFLIETFYVPGEQIRDSSQEKFDPSALELTTLHVP